MERFLLAAIFGVLSLLIWPTLPNWQYLLIISSIIAVLSCWLKCLRVVVFCTLAMTWSVWSAEQYLQRLLPHKLENKAFKVQVKIEGLSEYQSFGQRVSVKPIKIVSNIYYPIDANTHWQLSAPSHLILKPQQIWQMTVTLKRPHGSASAGAFDYQAWLLSENISAIGKVGRAQLIEEPKDWSFDLWRWQIRQQFQQLFADQTNAGVVLALLTGDRALVAEQAWDLYTTTGISHLMAISGPHVLLAASAVTWLIMQLLMRFYPRIFLTIPKSQLTWPLLLMVAVAYGFLAGLSLPTLRTLMMLAGLTLLIGNRQEWPALKIWLLALTMVLLWQPLSVHSVSLWLSFVAVGLLFFWSGMQQKQEHKITQFIKLQLWITLALTPLTLALFAQVSWIAPLTNLLAIPWVGFVIVPLALLGLLSGVFSASLQSFCWWLAVQAVNGLNGYLSWWAAISFAKQSYVLSLLSIGFFMFMVVLWLLPRQISPRYLSLFFFLPLFYRWPSLAKGEVQLSVLDVGQGLSVLIQTQKHQLLYDTGANTSAGERIINPYLHYMGVKKLDALMISHNDKDHTGGADAVFRQFIPQQLWYSAKPQGYQPPSQTIHHECYAGQSWHWDGVRFEVLSPIVGVNYDKDNNRSCVLRVSATGFSVLLTGDMEAPAEQILLKQQKNLQSDILLLGHHGSKTSSTEAFIDVVQPKLAIVSAGYLNHFGHPAPMVVQRLQKRQIDIDNTIEQGTLRYHLHKQGFILQEAWRNRGHYWLNMP